jgi:hypothetical protein
MPERQESSGCKPIRVLEGEGNFYDESHKKI